MTEIEEIKAQIKVLEKKLSFLEELEKTKSPAEEAYKDWWGEYPKSIFNSDDVRWLGFQAGYNAAYEEKVSEWNEKEMIRQNLKTSLKELANGDVRPIDDVIEEAKAQQTEKWKELQRKIDAPAEGIYDNIDIDKLLKKWEENPPEFLKFELGKTLTDIIYRWWDDVFTTHSDWDMETSIEDLVDQIQLWLPKEQSAAGSQSIGVEELVQGFNDCLKKIKGKLR